MAWTLVRLKISLIAGGLRGDVVRTLAFVVGAATGVAAAALGFTGFALLRGLGDAATDLGVVAFAVFTLTWALVPVFAFRSDETLDPARFALLPLRPGQAAAGLLAAAGTGVAPIAATVALSGSVVGLPRSAGAVPVAVAAVALTVLTCLLLGRILPLVLLPLLARRPAEVVSAGMAVLVLLVAAGQRWLVTFDPDRSAAQLAALAGWLRWTPPGMAAQAVGDAGAGNHLAAAARLAGVAVVVAVLAWCWRRVLAAALVAPAPASGHPAARRRGRRGFGPRGMPARTAAVLGRELRYTWREPRRKANVATLALLLGCLLMLVAVVPAAAAGPGAAGTLMVLAGGIAALSSSANYFGLQGAALWSTAMATGGARDLRAELAGALLAATVPAVPMLAAFAALCTLVVQPDDAGLAGTALAAAPGCAAFGVALGAGALLSVLLPYPLPERPHNPFAGPGAGQGLVVSLTVMAALLTVNVCVAPVHAAVHLLGPGAAPAVLAAGAGYGALGAWAGIHLAARIGARRLPEIVERVGRPAG
ncbi:hypothetical protein [Marinitenerispora sediminis]|uniref:hypothetical protein n=1 Tax=Marinitenerispora sediminis TaxID=1931232 RepID=UPI000DF1A269|nr:hypothetical protein [Marinitenerispora sediminis]